MVSATQPARTRPKQENLLLSILFNVAAPSLIMTKLSKPELLGPIWALVVALAFPIGYGVYDFVKRKNCNAISILGFVSVLLSGVLGIFAVGGIWFAVKEAAVPAIIGIAVVATLKTKRPLVRTLIYNDAIIDTERVADALTTKGTTNAFEGALARASWMLALSFFLSAFLNFGLARYFLKSPPGTPEFTAELGTMNAWSWLIITLPCMAMMMAALWYLMAEIKKISGLKLEEILHQPPPKQS